jgi:hypothetical protein
MVGMARYRGTGGTFEYSIHLPSPIQNGYLGFKGFFSDFKVGLLDYGKNQNHDYFGQY